MHVAWLPTWQQQGASAEQRPVSKLLGPRPLGPLCMYFIISSDVELFAGICRAAGHVCCATDTFEAAKELTATTLILKKRRIRTSRSPKIFVVRHQI